MLPTFNLLRPQTLAEALRWLGSESNALPIAGGTNLLVDARAGKLSPDTVIDVSAISELREIKLTDDEIVIGSCVTIAELLESAVVRTHAPVLHAAAKSFANTLIRNRATIGGNLVNNAPCADTAPALLVHNAEVELACSTESRRILLDEFLLDPFVTKRQANEILTTVRIPIPPDTAIGRFKKMGLRKVSCMAKVDVALLLDFDDVGVCSDARIALGAACPVSMRVGEAETVLIGHTLNEERALLAAEKAAEAAVPRAGSEYKQQVVLGLVRRLLMEITDEVGGANA
ncbi:FAD binding domain-containing protein [Candidatus Bipolaricaulota bacterium]